MAEWYESAPAVEERSTENWYDSAPPVESVEVNPEIQSGMPGGPKVSQQELDAAKPGPGVDPNVVQEPLSYEGVQQENADQATAKQYDFYASGPNAKNKTIPDDFTPSTDMYSGVENPWKLYEIAAAKAKEHTLLGKPIVNGKILPTPIDYGAQETMLPNVLGANVRAASNVVDNIGDSSRELFKNIAVTGAAMIDETFGTKAAEYLDKSIADPPTAGRVTDALVRDGFKITVAAIAGGKLGAKTGQALTGKSSGFIAQTLAGLGTLIGGVAAQNPDDPTVLTGKKAMVTILQGVPVDENGTFSAQHLEKKYNQLVDAVALGMPVHLGARAGAIITNFANRTMIDPLIAAFSPAKRTNQMAEDILNKLNKNTPEGIDEIIQYIKANPKEVFSFAQDEIGDVTIKRTTMSALNEGADLAGDTVLATRALEAEKGALEKGLPGLLDLKKQPVRSLEEMQANAVVERGGLPAIEDARSTLANQARDQIDMSQALVGTAEEEQLNSVKQLADLYKTDREFASTIEELSKDSGIDVANKFKSQRIKEMLPELAQGVINIKDKKNTLYEAIPDNTEIDFESFADVVASAETAGALPASVREIITRNMGDADELTNIDFKTLYNEIRPKINAQIANLSSVVTTDREGALRSLQAIVDNIDNHQVEFIINNGDDDAINAATAASDFYKNVYLKYSRDSETPIGRLFQAYDQAYDEHLAASSSNYKFQDVAQSVIQDGLNDRQLYSSKQVIDFLEQPEYGGDPQKLVNYYKGEVADAISDTLAANNGDFSKLTPEVVRNALKAKGTVLKERFPEQTQQINDFINQFRTGKMGLEEAEALLKQTKDMAAETEKEVYGSVLGEFVQKGPKGPIEQKNGFEIFKGMFSKENNEAQITDVLTRIKASDNPLAQRGAEAAYLSYLQDSIQKTENSIGFNAPAAKRFLSDKASLWKYGEEIFANSLDPKLGTETIKKYKEVVGAVLKETEKNVPTSLRPQSENQVRVAAESALGFVVTYIYGKLNRTGAKVRETGGKILRSGDPVNEIRNTLDRIHSDPEYAVELFTKIKDNLNSGMSPETKKALISAMLLLGKNQLSEEDVNSIDFSDWPGAKMRVPNEVQK